ncbi:MAG: hypothetical protein J6Y15_05610 [Bacteroidaceae bacterium]|nr:hypothetical protein [Bacteroidaceae bacterium]
MFLKKLFFGVLAAFMVASCSNDDFADKEAANVQCEKCILRVKVKPFLVNDNDAETRAWVGISKNNKKFFFDFDTGDKFGVCALDGSFNAPYSCLGTMECDEDDNEYLMIDASQLHELLRNKECVAYYPYDPQHTPNDFKVLFCYNKQMQKDDDSDYMANNSNYFVSEPFCFEDWKSQEIEMKPINSVLKVVVTLPNLKQGKYRKIELETTNNGKSFYEYARCSISSNGFDTPETENQWKANTLSLNVSEMDVTGGEQEFYFTCFPTKTGQFVVKATTNDGVVYSSDVIAAKTFKAGFGYIINVTNMKMETTPKDGTENGYEYVDLGLPSGLKWAKMNLGAMSETDYGKYYAWGETVATGDEDTSNDTNYDYNIRQGHTSSLYVKRICYSWTYKWNNNVSGADTYYSWTKYCLDKTHGSVDGRTSLIAKDDAVIQNWGGSWRMPTKEEQKELLDNSYCVWTDSYNGTDVKGYIIYKALCYSDKGMVIKSGRTPSNSYKLSVPHIFLPAAGFRSFGVCALGTGEICSYLSSSLSDPEYCDDCHVTSIRIEPKKFSLGSADRCDGNSIRAVCE